jgi:hypothetical protein
MWRRLCLISLPFKETIETWKTRPGIPSRGINASMIFANSENVHSQQLFSMHNLRYFLHRFVFTVTEALFSKSNISRKWKACSALSESPRSRCIVFIQSLHSLRLFRDILLMFPHSIGIINQNLMWFPHFYWRPWVSQLNRWSTWRITFKSRFMAFCSRIFPIFEPILTVWLALSSWSLPWYFVRRACRPSHFVLPNQFGLLFL